MINRMPVDAVAETTVTDGVEPAVVNQVVEIQDDDFAVCEQAVREWASQGRALGKWEVPFTREELQVLLQANWQPFYHACGPDVGKPYDRVFDKHQKQCLMACIEDSASEVSHLGKTRCEEVRPVLLRKLASLNDDEVRRLVRIMDAFYYNCEELPVEDFFVIEED